MFYNKLHTEISSLKTGAAPYVAVKISRWKFFLNKQDKNILCAYMCGCHKTLLWESIAHSWNSGGADVYLEHS